MAHTIVLFQPTKPETRTYADYESINEAMEGMRSLDAIVVVARVNLF